MYVSVYVSVYVECMWVGMSVYVRMCVFAYGVCDNQLSSMFLFYSPWQLLNKKNIDYDWLLNIIYIT